MRLQRIFGILFLVLGLLLFLTPGTLAPVCPMKPDGSFMKCHWMDVAEQSVAAVVIFGGLLAVLWPAAFSGGIAAMDLALGAESFALAKSLIGGCRVHEMACNLYTARGSMCCPDF